MLIVVFFQSKYVYVQKNKTLFLLQFPFLFICFQLEIITRWHIVRDEA